MPYIQITKTLVSTSIIHRPDTFASDRCRSEGPNYLGTRTEPRYHCVRCPALLGHSHIHITFTSTSHPTLSCYVGSETDITTMWLSHAYSPDAKYATHTKSKRNATHVRFALNVAIITWPTHFASFHTIQYPQQNTSNWCKQLERFTRWTTVACVCKLIYSSPVNAKDNWS